VQVSYDISSYTTDVIVGYDRQRYEAKGWHPSSGARQDNADVSLLPYTNQT